MQNGRGGCGKWKAVDAHRFSGLDVGMNLNPIPTGCLSLMPYLHVAETARLIDFLKQAFGGGRRDASPVRTGKFSMRGCVSAIRW